MSLSMVLEHAYEIRKDAFWVSGGFIILEKIKAGFEAYFVGGSVRDNSRSTKFTMSISLLSGNKGGTTVRYRYGTRLGSWKWLRIWSTTSRTGGCLCRLSPSKLRVLCPFTRRRTKRHWFPSMPFALNEKKERLLTSFRGCRFRKQGSSGGWTSSWTLSWRCSDHAGFRFQASLGFWIKPAAFDAMKECAPFARKISVEAHFHRVR